LVTKNPLLDPETILNFEPNTDNLGIQPPELGSTLAFSLTRWGVEFVRTINNGKMQIK
jgi:hypothetical protein